MQKPITSINEVGHDQKMDYVFIFKPSAIATDTGKWLSQHFIVIRQTKYLEARERISRMVGGFKTFDMFKNRSDLISDLLGAGYIQLTEHETEELGRVEVMP